MSKGMKAGLGCAGVVGIVIVIGIIILIPWVCGKINDLADEMNAVAQRIVTHEGAHETMGSIDDVRLVKYGDQIFLQNQSDEYDAIVEKLAYDSDDGMIPVWEKPIPRGHEVEIKIHADRGIVYKVHMGGLYKGQLGRAY